ncbi:MAG: ADP-forming succinate--CoA ligase subunit beta [Bdellovibrionales bacterium]|nr:ADP-forming succinate--CoA ligase subunit beta [Bdellovibrionales bacterium]
MNIHEFQAKALLKKYGIPILESCIAHSSEEAVKAAQDLGGSSWVLKAQVHAGGRGKGGGIKIAKSLDEVKILSQKMIGMNLITPQTGKTGEKVHRILVEKTAEIDKEFYLALLVNRSTSKVSVIVSDQGGMDIEETARKFPDKIVRVNIHPITGLCSFQKRACADLLGLNKKTEGEFFKIIETFYSLFLKEDLSLLEVNPFVLTKDEKLCPLDAKVSLDSNAGYRHPHWSEYVLEEELNTPSAQAQLQGFSFVPLDGYIGCMVNGAGLAMATMDMIQLCGGMPANFLDVGGDADAKRIQTAFQFILKDPKVRGVLVNIFGGIVRCDLIAEGIIQAVSNLDMKIPLVVRLEGNSADEAKALLQKTNLNITSARGLKEATEQIISLTT